MLRLPGSIQRAHRQCLTSTFRTLVTRKSKWVQSRFIVPNAPTTAAANRSFSTSSSIMDTLPSNASQGVGTIDDAIKRSKSSSEVQKHVLKLPEVPRIPARKRTFHITHDELETHVRPLLSCHWHVGFIGERVTDDRQVYALNKLFTFKDFRTAVEFFDAVVNVQDEEDHHARVIVDYRNVYVSIHTHCAYPRTSEADPDTPIKVSGLTLRDVRFAVRTERLHGSFLDDERAVTKVPVDSVNLQDWSMEQLQRRYPAPRG